MTIKTKDTPTIQYHQILIFILRFGAVFMLAETLVHLLPIRYGNVDVYYGQSMEKFVQIFMMLWGSAALFFSLLCFQAARNIRKYLPTIRLLADFGVVHSLILFFLSMTNFNAIIPAANMLVWIPFYSLNLRFEGVLLIGFWIFVRYGYYKKWLTEYE